MINKNIAVVMMSFFSLVFFSSSAFAGNRIQVNLGNQTWKAYDDGGRLVNSGHVSGGKKYCPDIRRACRTPTGTYTVYSKGGSGCKSSRFPVGRGGAPMPYCMFFKGGYALHGSNSVPNTMRATVASECLPVMQYG